MIMWGGGTAREFKQTNKEFHVRSVMTGYDPNTSVH